MRILILPLLLAAAFGVPRTAAAQEAQPRIRDRARVQVPSTVLTNPVLQERATAVNPPGTACPPAPPVRPCPPCEGAKRRVLPDDTVEVTYTDGTVKVLRPDGSSYTTYPDGTSVEETGGATIWRDKDGNETARQNKWRTFSHVPYATPPEPPTSGSTLARWLERQNYFLLTTLQTLLAGDTDGQKSLDQYLEREKALGLYEQIASRSELLQRILTQ